MRMSLQNIWQHLCADSIGLAIAANFQMVEKYVSKTGHIHTVRDFRSVDKYFNNILAVTHLHDDQLNFIYANFPIGR